MNAVRKICIKVKFLDLRKDKSTFLKWIKTIFSEWPIKEIA